MQDYGVWEKVYLQSLHIHELKGHPDSLLQDLCAHLSTIEFLLPEKPSPDEDFELFVLAKICRLIHEQLNICSGARTIGQ